MSAYPFPPFGAEAVSGKVYLVHAVNGAGKSCWCAALMKACLSRGIPVASNLSIRRDSLTDAEDRIYEAFADYGEWAKAYAEERKSGKRTAPMTLLVLDEAERFFGNGAEKKKENAGLEEIVMQTRSLGVSHVLAYPSVDGSGLSLLFRRRCAARIVPCRERGKPLWGVIEAPELAKVRKFPPGRGASMESSLWSPSDHFHLYRTDGGVEGDDYVVASGEPEIAALARKRAWIASGITVALGISGWLAIAGWAGRAFTHPPKFAGLATEAPAGEPLTVETLRALYSPNPGVSSTADADTVAVESITGTDHPMGVLWRVTYSDGSEHQTVTREGFDMDEPRALALWRVSQ